MTESSSHSRQFAQALLADDAPALLQLSTTHPELLHQFVALEYEDVAAWLGSVDEEDAEVPALYAWHAAAWLNKPQALLALLSLPEDVQHRGRAYSWRHIDGVEESLATLMARNGMHDCLDKWLRIHPQAVRDTFEVESEPPEDLMLLALGRPEPSPEHWATAQVLHRHGFDVHNWEHRHLWVRAETQALHEGLADGHSQAARPVPRL